MRSVVCSMVLWGLLLGGEAPAQQRKPFVAVADLHLSGALGQDQVRLLTDVLRNTLIELDHFVMLDRSNMDKIFAEQKFLLSGACDVASCQTRIGQLLGVERIVTGTIGKVGSTYSLVIQLTNVSTGEIERTAEESYRGESDGLIAVVKQQAYKLCGLPVPLELVLGTVATSATGDLYVNSEPQGASVYVDGRSVKGTTPLMIEQLPVGAHQLRLLLGELTGTLEVEVRKDSLEKLNLPLAKEKLQLRIITNPPDAEVYSADKLLGRSPLTLSYDQPGLYTLRVLKEGFAEVVHAGELTRLKTETVRLTLKPGLAFEVQSTPPGAAVHLDGQQRGHTPWRAAVTAGKHEFVLTLEGYEILTKEVEVSKPETLALTLTPIPAFLSVRCLPEGTILLDGKELGLVDRFETQVGTHELTCRQATWLEKKQTVELTRGQHFELTLQLAPEPAQVTLTGLPEEARLLVDGGQLEEGDVLRDGSPTEGSGAGPRRLGKTLFLAPGKHCIEVHSLRNEPARRELVLQRAERQVWEVQYTLKPVFAEYERKYERKKCHGLWSAGVGISLVILSATPLHLAWKDIEARKDLVERGENLVGSQSELDDLRGQANAKASSALWKAATGFTLLGAGMLALGYMTYNYTTLPILPTATLALWLDGQTPGAVLAVRY